MSQDDKSFVDQGAAVLRRLHASFDKDRGSRAELRRARSLAEIFLCPTFHARVLGPLEATGDRLGEKARNALAASAGLLAHCRRLAEDEQGHEVHLARLMAGKGDPVVHPLRFRRLLAAKPGEELFTQLGRVLRKLEAAPPAGLLRAFLDWDRCRRDWAGEYFSKISTEKQA